MARLFCGCSGWNYKHWRDTFYEGSPQSEWLSRYSAEFHTVELNNSFYRLPSYSTFEKWRDATPEGFTFAVKASRYLTHIKRLRDPEEPLQNILGAAAGLGPKLGPVLYQFPPNWHLDLDRLEAFLKLLPKDIRHVVEFRDRSWQNERVWELLRHYGAAYCIMSSPGLPFHLLTTADFSYARMHSGGEETSGDYTDEHLSYWAGQIHELLKRGDVYVYFNNDYNTYAVYNARTLRRMVEGG